MGSHRIERINGQIQRELSLLVLQKIKDSRIRDKNVSITQVKATPDLKTATVYVSILGDEEEKENVLEVLNHASSFLRSNLGHTIKLHSVPALTFVMDNSVEYGMHIESILNDIKKKKEIQGNDEENS
ncbi:30S ribosome-binding factor RbfA [Eubacteriaceae bacterium ES3]|nr:30S ribosome-binding factor RbfA [Eubacteriaceae bacterium ES3]